MNIYEKLLEARVQFLAKGVQKSGKNMAIQFKYFELEDIVPAITEIFANLKLLSLVTFTSETASLTIVNTERPDEQIVFESPMRFAETNKGVNPLQALGSSHTYLRRYLYFLALNIVEPDAVEPTLTPDKPTEDKKPATPEKREEAKKELANPDDMADELQIKTIKKGLTKLKSLDKEQDEFVQSIAVKTKNFTELTKKDAETLIAKLKEMVAAYKVKGADK